MNRWNVLSGLMLGAVAVSTAAQKPNVLFIAIDDMKPLIGVYGDSVAQTPKIDTLGAGGMVFLNNQCQWPVCGPTRASIMTSLMPSETGVMGFKPMRNNDVAQLNDLVTLPQHFKNNGYETAAIGKVNDPRCVGTINKNGKIAKDGRKVDDPPSWSIPYDPAYGAVKPTSAIRVKDGAKVKMAVEVVDRPDGDFTDGVVCENAIKQLGAFVKNDQPFFLAIGFRKPHLAFLMPKTYWDLYTDEEMPVAEFPHIPADVSKYTFNKIRELHGSYYLETNAAGKALPITQEILPEDQQRKLLRGYYASVSFIDAQIGRVLDELDKLGIADHTIVVLWGDHGWHLGDHNRWGKHTTLEQAARAPLIIRAPGHFKGGKTESPTEFLDLYPTLCELANLPIPTQPIDADTPTGRPLRGKSLIPILDDPNAMVRKGAITMFGSKRAMGYSYRTKRYRYVEWIDSHGNILDRELFDYETDPLETYNLGANPESKKLMNQLSRQMRSEGECEGCDVVKNSAPAK